MSIKVSSVNVQNRYKVKKYAGVVGNNNYHEKLLNYLEDNKIDIAGLQEVTSLWENKIKDKFNVSGKSRFNILYRIFLPQFEEKNSVISKHSILKSTTYHLPHFPSLLPRIITVSIISIDNDEYVVFNTHLDYKDEKVRFREITKILKIIDRYEKYPNKIFMGDLNMPTTSKVFIHFCKEMKNKNFTYVDYKDTTHKKKKSAIDHIFISTNLRVVDKKIFKDEKYNFSDHYPVYLEIKKEIS